MSRVASSGCSSLPSAAAMNNPSCPALGKTRVKTMCCGARAVAKRVTDATTTSRHVRIGGILLPLILLPWPNPLSTAECARGSFWRQIHMATLRRITGWAVGVFAVWGCMITAPANAQTHALDALTADEIRVASETAKADSRVAGALFPSITLNEPSKAEVLAWQPGQPLARQARVLAMTANGVFEILVDVGARRLISVTERAGAEPSITMSEIEGLKFVLANAE